MLEASKHYIQIIRCDNGVAVVRVHEARDTLLFISHYDANLNQMIGVRKQVYRMRYVGLYTSPLSCQGNRDRKTIGKVILSRRTRWEEYRNTLSHENIYTVHEAV